MKEIKETADIANATAIDLGPLAEIKDYVLELGPNVKIPGKVFGGAAVKAGGADFSLLQVRHAGQRHACRWHHPRRAGQVVGALRIERLRAC